MVICPTNYPLQFEKIRCITLKNWINTDWIHKSRPGDILLFANDIEGAHGFLRIHETPSFILVTPRQIRDYEIIRWPDHTKKLCVIKIVDCNVVCVG